VVGAIDWGSVGDWIEAHGVTTTIALALIGAAYKIGTRRRDRRDQDADKAGAKEADRQRGEDQLDSTHVDFGHWASVPFGTGKGHPKTTPLTIEVYEASVWIHGVRLRWRWNKDPADQWRLEGGECSPYAPGVEFPVAVPMGETLELTWAGLPLPKQEAIEWNLDIEWGLSSSGPTRTKHVDQGSTSWQEVPD
jgi:hypothetical protein